MIAPHDSEREITTLPRAQFLTAAAAIASGVAWAFFSSAPLEIRLLIGGACVVASMYNSLAILWFVLFGMMAEGVIGNYGTREVDPIAQSDFLAVVSLLLFAVCGLRRLELATVSAEDPATSRSRIAGIRGGSSVGASLRPLRGVAVRVGAAVVISWLALWFVPPEKLVENSAGLPPEGYRGVIFAWTLVLAAIVMTTVFSLLRWRRFTGLQARVAIRRVIADELRAERKSILRSATRR